MPIHMTHQEYEQQLKLDKLDFIKIRIFCASKVIIKNVKKRLTEWEEIFANHLSDQGLVSKIKIHKNIKTLITTITKRHFSKEAAFLQRRSTNSHEAHEKMLNIISH